CCCQLFCIFIDLLRLFMCYHSSPSDLYSLSLHDALPISESVEAFLGELNAAVGVDDHYDTAVKHLERSLSDLEDLQYRARAVVRSEEHTSELQSRFDLVCRLLLEKKNLYNTISATYSLDH